MTDKQKESPADKQSWVKLGFCLPAGPMVTDEDVYYIVECIKEAIGNK